MSLLAFVVLFVVIDLVDRLSSFIDQATSLWAIFSYYIFYIPYVVVLVLPMAVLLAGLFCMGTLIRNGEMLAMKAVGVSLYQIVLPLQMCTFMVSLLAFVLSDRVVPFANHKRAHMVYPRNPELGPRYVRTQVVLRDIEGYIFTIGEYEPSAQRGRNVILDRINQNMQERIRAEEMIWENDRWVFYRGEGRIFYKAQELYLPFDVRTVEDITLIPADFAREDRPEEEMTVTELKQFIERKERNGSQALREAVAMHMRYAFPAANFVIGFFGLPMASRMRRTGRPFQVGVCLLTCFVFYGCIQIGRVMGWHDVVPPVWGAWGANVLFVFLGVFLLVKTRK